MVRVDVKSGIIGFLTIIYMEVLTCGEIKIIGIKVNLVVATFFNYYKHTLNNLKRGPSFHSWKSGE